MRVRLSVQLGWLAGACFALVGACTLNPQPLPPLAPPALNDSADASAGSTTQFSGSDSGVGNDTGTVPKADAGGYDVDATENPDVDAGSDGAPIEAGIDASSAIDGGGG